MLDMLKRAGRSAAGAFVELDESTEAPTAQAPAVTPAKANAAPVQIIAPSVDQEMVKMLHAKILARTTPYTALLENAKVLEDIIPDETTRLKAAFKTIASGGSRTVAGISQAIDVHVTDIEGERTRFKQASDKQIQSAAGTLRSQVENMKRTNADSEAQLQRLQAETQRLQELINTNGAQIIDLTTQADQAEAGIIQTAAEFDKAVDAMKNDLLAKKASLTALLS